MILPNGHDDLVLHTDTGKGESVSVRVYSEAAYNRLWLALDDALKSFKLTQDIADYGENHWSNRAQRALQGAEG